MKGCASKQRTKGEGWDHVYPVLDLFSFSFSFLSVEGPVTPPHIHVLIDVTPNVLILLRENKLCHLKPMSSYEKRIILLLYSCVVC